MSEPVRRKKELKPVRLISNTEIKSGVFVIELEKIHDYIPGQIVAVAMHPDDDLRLYSIASGVDYPYLRILFDRVPDGQLTPPMSELRAGDTLYVTAPFGRFTKTPENSWWIATGTGIAPFISMAESGEARGRTLLHGARYSERFYYQELFKEKMGDRYLRFCTMEEGPGLISGRITTFIKESDEIKPENKYYLCGNADMVVEVRQLLLTRGVPFDNIIAEIYF